MGALRRCLFLSLPSSSTSSSFHFLLGSLSLLLISILLFFLPFFISPSLIFLDTVFFLSFLPLTHMYSSLFLPSVLPFLFFRPFFTFSFVLSAHPFILSYCHHSLFSNFPSPLVLTLPLIHSSLSHPSLFHIPFFLSSSLPFFSVPIYQSSFSLFFIFLPFFFPYSYPSVLILLPHSPFSLFVTFFLPLFCFTSLPHALAFLPYLSYSL